MASKGGKVAKGGGKTAVRVYVRVRPTNKREIEAGGHTCVKFDDTLIDVQGDEGSAKFSFDQIFGDKSTQEEVYTITAGPLIEEILTGYNGTIFAYGQTGTGKTHTMEGDLESEEMKGIIPRTVEDLFDGVSEADENIEFTFKVSYVEIYLERIRDLLDENRVKINLTVREDKVKGVYIADVTEEYVTSVEELLDIMHFGAGNRATAATGMNEGSSRSHSVFTIVVGQRDMTTNATKSGKLVLVDLAGSEMVKKTNASGQQLEEAKTINKSLSALGQVINALTDNKQSHIPYRDSKLTRVLQDSLGGNSKTVLIVAVSPSSFNANETIATLRFGNRAKSIENKVKINQTRSVEELEALLMRAEKAIDAQTAHIITLSTQLQALQAAPKPKTEVLEPGDKKAVLKEGEVVVTQKKLNQEAAALMRLEEQLNQVNQELDEERQESQRKETELKGLEALLKEKERLIGDAAAMLSDVQRSNESLKERFEVVQKEKLSAMGELESLKATNESELSKLKYDMMELEVTVTRLNSENYKLQEEISQMSGDEPIHQAPAPVATEKIADSMQKMNVDSPSNAEQNNEDITSTVKRVQNARKSFHQGNSGSERVDAVKQGESDNELKQLTTAERKELMEMYSSQFAAACMEYKLDEQISADLFSIMDNYGAEQEKVFMALDEKILSTQKSSAKRIRDLEDQRHRLEKDLKNKIENMIQLQMQFDNLGKTDASKVGDALAEKQAASHKSLQQRLEQLVAVHRQLLRKFASLELESVELKRKTQLRDERIRQLEGSSRSLIGNIRAQAERHVAELGTLREQIQTLKAEQEMREKSEPVGGVGATPRTKHGHTVGGRTLRGGGGFTHESSFRRFNSSTHFFESSNQLVGGGNKNVANSNMFAKGKLTSQDSDNDITVEDADVSEAAIEELGKK